MTPRARGLTLIELLIAIALMLALVGVMFGFFFDMLRARELALLHVRQQDAVAAIIRQLDADLMTCIAADSQAGAGVRGDSQSLRLLSRAVAGSLAPRGVDDPYAFGDLQFTEYRFDAESAAIKMNRGPAGRGGDALSKQDQLDGPIYRLRFRYYDGGRWLDSFDSAAAGRLPVAVEVGLWLSRSPQSLEAEQAPPRIVAEAGQTPLDPSTQPATRPGTIDDEASVDGEQRPDRLRVFLVPDAAAAPPSQRPSA